MTRATVVRTASALRKILELKGSGSGSVGFVPTMGALHEGHLSLVRRARRENGRVVVSIFVNPTQFGEKEDFSRYPRELAADRRLLAPLGPLWIYAPGPKDIYPDGFASTVTVGGSLSRVLEAVWRPGHFDGVSTVVARLFGLVRPDKAYFGLKDYQQYLVVRRMVSDLNLPVALTGCPIVREKDGLAMSSRNRRLSPLERAKALALSRALRAVAGRAAQGETSLARLRKAGWAQLKAVRGLKVQYFELADPDTLLPLPGSRLLRPAMALTACVLGNTRLIDNHALAPKLGGIRKGSNKHA